MLERRAIIARRLVQSARAGITLACLSCYHTGRGNGRIFGRWNRKSMRKPVAVAWPGKHVKGSAKVRSATRSWDSEQLKGGKLELPAFLSM